MYPETIAPDDQDAPLVIGGRTFRPAAETTALHDGWVWEQSMRAGLDGPGIDGTADEIGREIVRRALVTNTLYHLLAGSLVEDGVEWTPERAEQNARFFRDLRGAEDKARMFGAAVGVLLNFFPDAPASSATSPSSSSGGGTETTTAPGEPDAGTASATGAATPETSPDTIQSARGGPSTGGSTTS